MKTSSLDASSPVNASTQRALSQHPRHWRDFVYVYPVISRRSHGLSIGINLNVDRVCNFDCTYCQVDRSYRGTAPHFDVRLLARELDEMIQLAVSGLFWRQSPFSSIDPDWQHVTDIAFSGDGEPTTCPQFGAALQVALQRRCIGNGALVKIVVLTNASMLDRRAVRRVLERLDFDHDELWVKLDAGTERDYRRANRSPVPYHAILSNILNFGRSSPIVIQTMLMKQHGSANLMIAFDRYIARLEQLRKQGCQIKRVQLYTIARQPAQSGVSPIGDVQLNVLGSELRRHLPGVSIELACGYGGSNSPR